MSASIFETDNLFAWCVASHDKGKRNAEDRCAMLQSLGFTGQAWGNRMAGVKDLPRFEEEMAAMKAHGLKLVARYVPSSCPHDEKRKILDAAVHHGQKPQIWATGAPVSPEPASQTQRVAEQLEVFEPWARVAADYGLKVGLYNHAGWCGHPDNQLAIIHALHDRGLDNVGIALCQHWSHDWLDAFEAKLQEIKPYLLAISLSGMTRDGVQKGQQFLPVGAGDEDLRLLGALERSGWRGPVGLINHTDIDAAERLPDHLAGLAWIRQRLAGEDALPPAFRTWPDASCV